ncbi:hypothetical protein N7527_005727 [Penicillium freii]|nr:hypothetical protein N7527_005727 [Penicillium freii]
MSTDTWRSLETQGLRPNARRSHVEDASRHRKGSPIYGRRFCQAELVVFVLVAAVSAGPGDAGRENSGRDGGRGALQCSPQGRDGATWTRCCSRQQPGRLPDPARNAPLTPRDQSHNIFTLVHTPGLPPRETTRAKAI